MFDGNAGFQPPIGEFSMFLSVLTNYYGERAITNFQPPIGEFSMFL